MSNEKENKIVPENKDDEQNREISLDEASEVNGGVKLNYRELDFPLTKKIDKPILRRTDF